MAPVVQGIQFLERLGFADIVLWLLSFALVYGLLSHIGKGGMPESKVARAIIAIVAAFFVLLSVPSQLIMVLSQMSTGLVVLVLGLLVFMVFLELAEVRVGFKQEEVEPGKIKTTFGEKVFEKHANVFAVLLIIFAVIIFIAAGGLNLLGFNIFLSSSTTTTLLILGVIVLAVYWLIKEK